MINKEGGNSWKGCLILNTSEYLTQMNQLTPFISSWRFPGDSEMTGWHQECIDWLGATGIVLNST